jgi:4-oxalocrotonate tautomerase
MPLQRIDMVQGRPEAQRRAIADAVHRALVESMGVPQEDRFQIVTEHPRAGFLCTPAYLGIRHDDPVLIQLTISVGRTTEQKQELYRRIAELLEAVHVSRSDAIINLVEVTRDDWSFGDGVAQYVPGASLTASGSPAR